MPANEIIGLPPGEVFVHRNIANVVVHSDLNCLSVIQFAVDILRVKHIMVVGHYGCSGVNAALLNRRVGLADNWLHHVQDVRERHTALLDAWPVGEARYRRLIELNAIEQVVNVCRTTIVNDAWARGQSLTVHGRTACMTAGCATSGWPCRASTRSTRPTSAAWPRSSPAASMHRTTT